MASRKEKDPTSKSYPALDNGKIGIGDYSKVARVEGRGGAELLRQLRVPCVIEFTTAESKKSSPVRGVVVYIEGGFLYINHPGFAYGVPIKVDDIISWKIFDPGQYLRTQTSEFESGQIVWAHEGAANYKARVVTMFSDVIYLLSVEGDMPLWYSIGDVRLRRFDPALESQKASRAK